MNEKACRRVVAARSGGLCEICGHCRAATMHHRRKRSQGGPWAPSNVLHLCGDGTTGCHGLITNTRTVFYARGWLVHSWDDWALTPVRLAAVGLVLLDDSGMYRPAPELLAATAAEANEIPRRDRE